MSRTTEAHKKAGMIIVYDGACPFCSNFVRMIALRKNVGSLELIDARSDHPQVVDLWKRGYDLNGGMAAIFGATVYYGSDAVALISSLSSRGGILSSVLRNPSRARLLYPWMKLGRRLALRLLRRPDLAPAAD